MKNPFHNQLMRREFDGMVEAYRTRHKVLFYPDGTPCKGSSMASSFWDGFNGVIRGMGAWDKSSKDSVMYAHWKAGEACRKEENRLARS